MTPAPSSVAAFHALAYALACDAAEAYALLADQMETHHNRAAAAIFRELAEIEARQADEVLGRAAAAGCAVDALDRLAIHGFAGAQPALEEAHYQMGAHQALALALRHEEAAAALFAEIERSATGDVIRRLAAAARAEELRHIERVGAWLAGHAAPADDWADDPDPPVHPE